MELLEEPFQDLVAPLSDWKERLYLSRRQGDGFAAPGGEFTRAFGRWLSQDAKAATVRSALNGGTLIELGAGMFHYGFALAALAKCHSYLGVEPYYADYLKAGIHAYTSHLPDAIFPTYKIIPQDMLSFLTKTPDDSADILACGIEQCILPDFIYRAKVEREIARVVGKNHCFIASQSDLTPHIPIALVDTITPHKRRKMDRFCLHSYRFDLPPPPKNSLTLT